MRLALGLQTLVGAALALATLGGAWRLLHRTPWVFGLTSARLALVLVALALSWLATNTPTEGPTLLTVAPGRGLTVGDLPALPAALVAVALVLTHR